MQNAAPASAGADRAHDRASPPHSRRMGMHAPPLAFDLHALGDALSSPASPPAAPPSPPVPPRSPLRPNTKSVASFTTLLEHYTHRDRGPAPALPDMPLRSISSLSALLDAYALGAPTLPPTPTESMSWADETSLSDHKLLQDEKLLPILPRLDSPISISLAGSDDPADTDAEGEPEPEPDDEPEAQPVPATPAMSKRTHALHELLSSERAYASDLVFIRDVHIPLALGQPTPFQLAPITPPGSSGSSARTLSTASDSSGASAHGAPMTHEDTRVIFGNVGELAAFADMLGDRLEHALGATLDGGHGEDAVGQLFLEIVPQIEPLYKTYITRHPSALAHLGALPQTPALAAYLAQTRTLASSVTHAWDLPSLLIKPVQRLLKYPLLLSAVLDETPAGHGDRARLAAARDRMEEVARGVNEGRRRLEIVREVLAGTGLGAPGAGAGAGAGLGLSPPLKKKLSVGKGPAGLARIKSARGPPPAESSAEGARVAELEARLQAADAFVRNFARAALHWSTTVRGCVERLRAWAAEFGAVIGLAPDAPSDAFDAFRGVIDGQLSALCAALDDAVRKELFVELARVLGSSRAPQRLLQAMHALEPLHLSLLNLNYAKHRPPAALLDASQSFVALRAQLDAELPAYLALLARGVRLCVARFARRQTEFWGDARERWGELWDALRMEGETNGGSEETLRVWWDRFREVDEAVAALSMLRRERPHPHPHPGYARSVGATSSLGSPFYRVPSLPGSPTVPRTPSGSGSGSASISGSGASARHRSRGSFDIASPRSLGNQVSTESLPTRRNRSRPRTPDPLGHRRARSNTSPPASSSSPSFPHYDSSSASSVHQQQQQQQQQQAQTQKQKQYRGRQGTQSPEREERTPRSPSFRRRLSETLRPRLGRSPSLKTSGSPRAAAPPARARTPPARAPTPHRSPTPPHFPAPITPDSPALYSVRAVHPCAPPGGAEYLSLPFVALRVGDVFDVLSEAGHPSLHDGLPLYVDDGADCLLVVRDARGALGWALASFVVPL